MNSESQLPPRIYRGIIVKIILANFCIPLSITIIYQSIISLFNPYLVVSFSIQARIALAFRPIIYILFLFLAGLVTVIIFLLLRPLFIYLQKGTGYRQARKATLKIPWLLIFIHTLTWIIAVVIFYMGKTGHHAGTIPITWSLCLNISSGFLGAIFTALILNNILITVKRKLHIVSIEAGEKDYFARYKEYIILINLFMVFGVFFAYLGNYYYTYGQAAPLRPIPSFTAITGGLCLIFGGMYLMARREYFYQVRLVKRELKKLSDGSGDLTQRVKLLNFDEIGELCHEINSFIELFNHIITTIKQVIGNTSILSGSLQDTVRENEVFHWEFNVAMENIVKGVHEEEEQVKTSKTKVTSVTENTADNIKSLLEQVTMIDQISVLINNMLHSFSEITGATTNTSNISGGLKEKIRQESRQLEEFYTNIQEISSSADIVFSTIHVISDIAETTNLLAINASIEAAHHGQEGKGFAVIAAEIKKLAYKTATSAGDIITYVDTMQTKIKTGVKAVERLKISLENTFSGIQEITGEITSIAAGMEREKQNSDTIIRSLSSFAESAARMQDLSESQQKSSRAIDGIMTELQQAAERTFQAMREIESKLKQIKINDEKIKTISIDSTLNSEKLKQISSGFKV